MINSIFSGVTILNIGSQAMQDKLMPKFVSGEIDSCLALTEPDSISDSLDLRTTAEQDGNGWRLNGRKIFIVTWRLVTAQTTSKAIERAMQTMGGMGYARAPHLERLSPDCRLFRFAPISE